MARGGLQRNYPNSGNLGSVEIFPIIRAVCDAKPGIYHYDTVQHHLSCLQLGDFHEWLCSNVLFQPEFAQASVFLVLTGAIGRLTSKYGARGYRLALLDVGHVSQNIALMASALGLVSCPTAGLIDDELDQALKLDGLETACQVDGIDVYLCPRILNLLQILAIRWLPVGWVRCIWNFSFCRRIGTSFLPRKVRLRPSKMPPKNDTAPQLFAQDRSGAPPKACN